VGLASARAEKLADAFTSTSNVALANDDVGKPKKTIARSIGPSYQTQLANAKYRLENITGVISDGFGSAVKLRTLALRPN
jgi:hypothetical protein